ncbi:uncharacterized protein BDZ99DRAFT_212259 [Mytilinidion resinicola]|uniref:SAM domain-containing protein n=1 Tax=Mytilinidion resinicola TaxID=574789 RepID=A0A6A6Y014_9PEZI|nr:uncharacterized protein BDZ99DRAFT_212259 [Mytilinidion resinicola]KAF2801989.1 hypothetical protein BDZ99DRAFT_212259 [Mytilinidion resinicola]
MPQHLSSNAVKLSDRRRVSLGQIALPVRPSASDLVQNAAVVHQSYLHLCAVLESLDLSQYRQTLVDHGFNSWESMLNINENDFEQLKVKRGHRRKLERIISISANDAMSQLPHCTNALSRLKIGKHPQHILDYMHEDARVSKQSLIEDKIMEQPGQVTRPVACFYVQPRIGANASQDPYYRAMYLKNRTREEFLYKLGTKCDVTLSQIIQTVRVNKLGLECIFDDAAVCDLAEGQDMVAEFQDIQLRSDWNVLPDMQDYSNINSVKAAESRIFVLRLYY